MTPKNFTVTITRAYKILSRLQALERETSFESLTDDISCEISHEDQIAVEKERIPQAKQKIQEFIEKRDKIREGISIINESLAEHCDANQTALLFERSELRKFNDSDTKLLHTLRPLNKESNIHRDTSAIENRIRVSDKLNKFDPFRVSLVDVRDDIKKLEEEILKRQRKILELTDSIADHNGCTTFSFNLDSEIAAEVGLS